MRTKMKESPSAAARRAWRAVATYLARAPGTHVLLLVVSVTTLMLRGLDATTATRVLRESSTNLVLMSRSAPRVLFLSAFLLDHGHLIVELALFTVLMVPVERWIGTYRWLGVFAAGHVGATLATTIGIWLEVRSGVAGRALVYPLDVGVSYGLAAVAAVLSRRLPRPLGELMAIGLGGWLVFGVVYNGTFTDWGHLAAFAIGFALAPLVRPRDAPRLAQIDPGSAVLARAWHWLATPPPPPPTVHTTAVMRALGWLMVSVAAGLVVTLALTSDAGIKLAASATTVHARVLGATAACGPSCHSTVVRYRINGSLEQATIDVPTGILLRRGDRIDLVVDPATSNRPRLPSSARRVNASGLFGALAAIFAGVGIAVVALARRPRRNDAHSGRTSHSATPP
jgi:hypothetical protein